MVIAQQSGLTNQVYQEPTATGELQDQLDRDDAAHTPALRERYPVVSRDEIKNSYPDQWIALLPTHVDQRDRLIAGRLVAHAQDWPAFNAAVRAFRDEYPALFPFVYFTGRYPMGRDVVHV